MRRLLFSAVLVACGFASHAQFDPGDMFIGETIAPEMDAVYTRGIQFLKSTQSADGSWPGTHGTEPGVVGLSVLSILAHGEDPNHGPYAQTIRRGIDFILKNQAPNGYIGRSMYNHGFASLALGRVLWIPRRRPHWSCPQKGGQSHHDLAERQSARRLALFARIHRRRQHGQRRPDGRTLRRPQRRLEIPDKAIKRGLAYFKSCQTPDGGIGYTGPGGPNSARTAIGALAFALAREKEDPAFQSAFKYLKQSGFDPTAVIPCTTNTMPRRPSSMATWRCGKSGTPATFKPCATPRMKTADGRVETAPRFPPPPPCFPWR
jgi:hypothetical protein